MFLWATPSARRRSSDRRASRSQTKVLARTRASTTASSPPASCGRFSRPRLRRSRVLPRVRRDRRHLRRPSRHRERSCSCRRFRQRPRSRSQSSRTDFYCESSIAQGHVACFAMRHADQSSKPQAWNRALPRRDAAVIPMESRRCTASSGMTMALAASRARRARSSASAERVTVPRWRDAGPRQGHKRARVARKASA